MLGIRAGVAIDGDRITAVGDLANADAARAIDARAGRPGFKNQFLVLVAACWAAHAFRM